RYDSMLLPLLAWTSRFSHVLRNYRPHTLFHFTVRMREELSTHARKNRRVGQPSGLAKSISFIRSIGKTPLFTGYFRNISRFRTTAGERAATPCRPRGDGPEKS